MTGLLGVRMIYLGSKNTYLCLLQLLFVPCGGRKLSPCTLLLCSLYFLVLSDH